MKLKIFLIFSILSITCPLWAANSALDAYLGRPKAYDDVLVKEVVSTDTIKLDNDEYVYLIGLVAPEAPKRIVEDVERDKFGFAQKKPVDPATPIEERALTFAKDLLENKHIRIEFDIEKKDKNYKTQGYAFLLNDGTFVNAEILRQGYARLRIQPPNLKYEDKLRAAYIESREEKRGLQGE